MKPLLSAVIMLALPAVCSAGILPDYLFSSNAGAFSIHFDRTDIPDKLQYAINGDDTPYGNTIIDQANSTFVGGGRYFEDPDNPALGHDTYGWVILPPLSEKGTTQPAFSFCLDATNPSHWVIPLVPMSNPNLIVFGHVVSGDDAVAGLQTLPHEDVWDLHNIPTDGLGDPIVSNFNPPWGDANMDGVVDISDLSIVLNNFGKTTSLWTDGNFDGQPTIDLTDLSHVLNNFDMPTFSPTFGSAPPAPEPASISACAGLIVLALRRKR